MTREFNKRQRNDARPSFRHKSPEQYGEERSPRPARPRLSREVVDRAWEMGAQQQHADYRPRNNGQPPYQGRRNNQSTEHSSPQNGSNRHSTYRDRQDNYQGQNRRNGPATSNQRGPNTPPAQSFHANRHPSGRFSQEGGPPRFENNRPGRFNRPERDQGNHREPGNNQWQERRNPPGDSRNYAPREQYEGDYEYFSHDNQSSPPRPTRSYGPPSRDGYARDNRQHEAPERHVTRLPDGRVLKGSRPAQRQNARFWTDIQNESETLVSPVSQPPASQPEQSTPEQRKFARKPASSSPKSHTHDGSARGKKREVAEKKPRSTGPRPSQRGFKWPTS